MRTPVGTRVIAIESMDKASNSLSIFGYGVYDGGRVPPHGPFGMNRSEWEATYREVNGPDAPVPDFPLNPHITLDDGSEVWGNQCWWGPLDQFQTAYGAKVASGELAIKLVPNPNVPVAKDEGVPVPVVVTP